VDAEEGMMSDSSGSSLDSDLPENFLKALEEERTTRAQGLKKDKAVENKPSNTKTPV
jgi:hypothetical protein